MTIWQEILATAVVGTERQELSLPLEKDEIGRVLSGLDVSDREGALLRAAAVVSLYRRSGFRPLADAHSPAEVCEKEETEACSSEASQHLALMLAGEFKEALPEWLTALGSARRRVPEEHLPALLDKGQTEQGLRPLILPVIGSRGRWLASQNSAWQWAAARDESEVWETGSRDERLFLLRQLRAADPTRARELLSATWNAEAAKDRQTFLETFISRMSDTDEPFLSEALRDRSAEVRRTAGELLLRLPSSRLRRRVSERVSALLSYQRPKLGKAKLEVSLPDDVESWQKEGGLDLEVPPAGTTQKSLGKKGWWLLHAVSWVHPSTWCRAWNKKPAEVLEAARNSEWKEALLKGLVKAASRFADVEWIEAILTDRQIREENTQEANANYTELAPRLPAERLEALILKELSGGKNGFRIEQPALSLLLEHRRQWSDDLSRAVAACVKERISNARKNDLLEWQIKSALKQFALYSSPARCDELTTDWPADSEGWWRGAVEDFQSCLRFRRDMLRAMV